MQATALLRSRQTDLFIWLMCKFIDREVRKKRDKERQRGQKKRGRGGERGKGGTEKTRICLPQMQKELQTALKSSFS